MKPIKLGRGLSHHQRLLQIVLLSLHRPLCLLNPGSDVAVESVELLSQLHHSVTHMPAPKLPLSPSGRRGLASEKLQFLEDLEYGSYGGQVGDFCDWDCYHPSRNSRPGLSFPRECRAIYNLESLIASRDEVGDHKSQVHSEYFSGEDRVQESRESRMAPHLAGNALEVHGIRGLGQPPATIIRMVR